MTSRLLRAQVAALLPDGAFLRVDRTGRALYVTRSDADCAPPRSIPEPPGAKYFSDTVQ